MTLERHSPAATDSCTTCPRQSAAICRAVKARAAAAGRQGPRLRKLPQDWVLRAEGEPSKLSGILRRGYLRTERILEDGRRSIVDLAVPSDTIGLWTEGAENCTVSTATEVEICAFDPQILRSVMQRDPALRMEILRAASAQHARQLDLVWQRGALNSRERIIAFLVMAAGVMPCEPLPDGSLLVSIPISRRDWADITNTTVETICRTLGQLADQGVVQSVATARYRIADLAALTELAGLDPDTDRIAHGGAQGQRPWGTDGRPLGARSAASMDPALAGAALSSRQHPGTGQGARPN